jgi:hypothetical protein
VALTWTKYFALGFPFCFREEMIYERVKQISAFDAIALADEVARLFISHQGKSCRISSWTSYSLPILQLAAMCVGGRRLGVICLAMCINFKQLSSGAPDLLMGRVRLCSKSSSVTIPFEYFLGVGWDERHNRRDFDHDDLLFDDSAVNNGKKSKTSTFRPQQIVNDNIPEEDIQPTVSKVQLPSTATELKELWNTYSSSILSNDDSVDDLQLRFEIMFVEVKGPTDHLAYKQLLWLKLLSIPLDDGQSSAYVCHVKEE